jgi:hypothetical protein
MTSKRNVDTMDDDSAVTAMTTKRNAVTMDDDSTGTSPSPLTADDGSPVVGHRPAVKKPRDDAVNIKNAHLMKIAHMKEACEKRKKLTRDLKELEALSQDCNKWFDVISNATYDAAAYLVSTFFFGRLIQQSSTHNTGELCTIQDGRDRRDQEGRRKGFEGRE